MVVTLELWCSVPGDVKPSREPWSSVEVEVDVARAVESWVHAQHPREGDHAWRTALRPGGDTPVSVRTACMFLEGAISAWESA